MSIEYSNPEGLHRPTDNMYSHLSKAHGTMAYRIGGQVAVSEDGSNVGVGDMAAQIRCCYDMITRALESVGLTWRSVTHLYTFTVDLDSYLAEEQTIARNYFGDWPPPSTLVEVTRLVDRDWLVEVQADAVG